MKEFFDFEAFKARGGHPDQERDTLLGKDGVLTPLFKEFLEGALEGELDAHLEESEDPYRKNGKGRKQVKTPVVTVALSEVTIN